ncbi:AAA family ATPase [Aliarcobacter butzleri]|uniref:AAA family ATPase n=1 Tax=Aliarcobacter butzleri TaxID=28197 RepID=UPI0021B54F0B|nr:AAA family ATPase [Aliarcobacter butzleri]MCT7588048.1 AAA family ATPase [Aliarcobacter butzleri]
MDNIYNEYRKFLENSKTKMNNDFSEKTIKDQIKILSEEIPKKLNKYYKTDSYKNLFLITDLNEVKKIQDKFRGRNKILELNDGNSSSSSLHQYIKFLEYKNNGESNMLEKKINIKTKNIMLYGAPGVGKTHNYKKLVALIEDQDFTENEIFDFIINNKDDEILEGSVDTLYNLVKNEKRIEFVTFHQSYSYEDFIEGFRPNENGDIELDKKGGVFKRIADKARENLEESQKEKIQVKEEITFRQKLDSFIEKLEIEIEKKGYYEITDAAYISSIDSDAFRYNIRKENPTYKYDLRMKFEDLFEFEKNKVSSRQDVKKLETINSLANQHATYYYKVFNEIISNSKDIKINDKEINNVEQKNFYIVIDEINRGNISKIFGELITLIEEDKRDNYEVTLPYSKEKFKIPSNLYIIATMNSTDKSIATIDIALRRRFTFLKMKPNIDLVPQNAKELFITLNEFIGKNLGEDYKLGHSYFMQNLDLEFVKEYKIKPLLEEYFYGYEENYKEALKILEENR